MGPLSRGPRVLAMILAGGKGERLMPLTEHRSKPAVPFAAKYRLVDFVLSNCFNSGILATYVLVQYRSQSLIEHLRRAWQIGGRLPHCFVSVVPPQMRARVGWYEGNADAVYQNLNLIRDFNLDLVAVFGADHIYRMDINQMIEFHLEHRADVTVAARPVPLHAAQGLGIVEVSRDLRTGEEDRIVAFQEKPQHPKPMPSNPDQAYSSMGNYLFNTDALCWILKRDASRSGSHDFGRDIISHLIGSHRVLAYNFCTNEVPGLHPYEERSYWRDVGTLDAYWQAHMDTLGETPPFDLRNEQWPIFTDNHDGPSAALIRSHLDDAMVGQGSRLVEAEVRRSIIGRNVLVEHGAQIEESIILDGVTIGAKARLRRAIVDRYNIVAGGSAIGFDLDKDRKRYVMTASEIVVLPQGHVLSPAMRGRSSLPQPVTTTG